MLHNTPAKTPVDLGHVSPDEGIARAAFTPELQATILAIAKFQCSRAGTAIRLGPPPETQPQRFAKSLRQS